MITRFVKKAKNLYGAGFLSYNVHGLLHLVDDFKMYGSLDEVNAFTFESFLGLLKCHVKSGYKPLQQIGCYVYYSNNNVPKFSKEKSDELQKIKPLGKQKVALYDVESDHDVVFYKKAQLHNNYIILRSSCADSWVRIDGCLAKVVDICTIGCVLHVVIKRCLNVENLFTSPIDSNKIGIYKFYGICESLEVVKLDKTFVKCIVLPYKRFYVAFDFVHSES